MNRILITAALLLAGSGSYLTARQFAAENQIAAVIAKPQPRDLVRLPDPQMLAGSARLEVERIPLGVWSAEAGVGPEADGRLLAANGTRALPADLAAIPHRSAPSSKGPTPAAPVVLAQETPGEIAQALSGSISAIVRSNGAARLIIADRTTTVRRSLVPGDVFLAGWKLSRIDPGVVTLTKQGRSIAVPVAYSAGPSRPPLQAQTSTAAPPRGPSSQVAIRLTPGAPRRRVSRREAAEN